MERLRVVQWTTGTVGKLAIRAMLERPQFELVGVYAHSPDKVGVDAGTLSGRPDTGVKATDDIDALLSARPDVVLYAPYTGDVDHVVKLLETGVDVLSTNLFFHVGGVRGEVRKRFEAACARGGSSFYISGINPGWINSVATSLTAICGEVDCVSILESADCSGYKSPQTWNYFRLGQRGVTPEVIEAARTFLVMFRDAAERVGDALGLVFDDVTFSCEYATAAETVDLGWFLIEKGTNAAVRAGWTCMVDGRTAVRTQITWYLTDRIAEKDFVIDKDEYHIVIDGSPGIDMRMHFSDPPPSPIDGPWSGTSTTALAAVNALAQLKAARPGVLTLHDMGLPYAPPRSRG